MEWTARILATGSVTVSGTPGDGQTLTPGKEDDAVSYGMKWYRGSITLQRT